MWRYTTDEDIEFYRVTPLGDLIVATENEITVLFPESGEPKWTRSDFEDLSDESFNAIPFTSYGVLRTRDGIAMLDIGTGETMWGSTERSSRAITPKRITRSAGTTQTMIQAMPATRPIPTWSIARAR